jgi:hypothetical protein
MITPQFQPVTTCAPDSAIAVTSAEISKYLPIYRPEGIHVLEANYWDGSLEASFRPYIPDIYVRPPRHVTRIQIVHYVGQAAYILAGCFARAGKLAPLDEAGYIESVLEERATFRSLKLAFRRFIWNTESIVLKISFGNLHASQGFMTVKTRFDLNDVACVGEATAIIKL